MKPPAPDLAVSLVSHAPDYAVLERTLAALERAAEHARRAGALERMTLTIADNGPGTEQAERLRRFGARVLESGRNLGFGAGHNRALREARAEFALILNPDAVMAEDALSAGIAFLNAHPEVVLVAPCVDTGAGGPRHLCKRPPDPWTLLVRGFGPDWLRQRCRARLDRYAMVDLDPAQVNTDVPLASGSFMLLRTAAFHAAGGFDERYFLYFEDFDLCLRLRAAGGLIAYVPQVQIMHHAGGAARKGGPHPRLFLTSAWKYFRRHGFFPPR
jgi:GT2 family glycosyltransferase